MIFCKTTIGFGSPNKSGTSDAHGAPLGDEEIAKTREALNWNHGPFEIPDSIYEFWNAKEEGASKNLDWDNLMISYKEKYPYECR
jgi:transketolase